MLLPVSAQDFADIETIKIRAQNILAEQGTEAARKYLSETFDDVSDERVLYRLAYTEYLAGNYHAAELYGRHLTDSSYLKLAGASYTLLGNVYTRYYQSEYHDDVPEFFEKAIALHTRIGEYKLLYHAYLDYALSEAIFERRKHALEILAKAVKLSLENEGLTIARFHQTRGLLSMMEEDYGQAIFHFKQELNFCAEAKSYLRADIMMRLGKAYLGNKDPAQALGYLHPAREIFGNNPKGYFCQAYIHLADFCSRDFSNEQLNQQLQSVRDNIAEPLRAKFDTIMSSYKRQCSK